MSKVFAIIVTYNGEKWLDRCLGCLASSNVPVSIVVIDNASTDGTPDYIAEHFPEAHLIRSDINYGFAKANNIGIKYAIDNGADYVFLLNQDAWLCDADVIGKLISTFKNNEDVGIATPVNMNGEGSALDWMYATDIPGECVSDLYMGKRKSYYKATFINAAAWLLSTECIKRVGGFDTSLFVHYGEDNNYCHRVLFHKMDILVNTECAICHDREFRKNKENEYRQNSFKQDDVQDRIMWGNILLDINVDVFIAQIRRSIRRSYIKLRFRQIDSLKARLSFFETVKVSRELNKAGGLTWL